MQSFLNMLQYIIKNLFMYFMYLGFTKQNTKLLKLNLLKIKKTHTQQISRPNETIRSTNNFQWGQQKRNRN